VSKIEVGSKVRPKEDRTCHELNRDKVYEVTEVTDSGNLALLGVPSWWNPGRFELVTDPPQETCDDQAPQDLSHVWQVGRTYKTTLEGETVKVTEIDGSGDIAGERSDEQYAPWYWIAKTGRMLGRESHQTEPHLLPIEVEQPEPAPSKSQQIRDEAAEALAKVDAKRVDPVNHPPHYNQGSVECIDAIRAALTDEEWRGYCKGNALKYIWRERHKGGDESVAKAAWYLERMKGGE